METPTEEEQRANWRWLWLTSIQAFADADVQARRWTDPGEHNPYYSFVECMCSYFDDAFMGQDQAYEFRVASGHLSRTEVEAVTDFHRAAEAYKPPDADDYAVSAILADPVWHNLVRLAQGAQHRLLELLTDPAERATLTQPLDWREKNGGFYSGRGGAHYIR